MNEKEMVPGNSASIPKTLEKEEVILDSRFLEELRAELDLRGGAVFT